VILIVQAFGAVCLPLQVPRGVFEGLESIQRAVQLSRGSRLLLTLLPVHVRHRASNSTGHQPAGIGQLLACQFQFHQHVVALGGVNPAARANSSIGIRCGLRACLTLATWSAGSGPSR